MQKQFVVTGLSHEGRGVARDNGKIHFIDGALPNETVVAQRVATHARYDEWRLLNVVESSVYRAQPFCAVYHRCGGCALQHCQVDAQRQFKRQEMLEQLRRLAGITPRSIMPDIVSVAEGYRRRARLSINTYKGAFEVGFRERAGKNIVAFDSCPVLRDELNALLAPLSALLAALTCRSALGHVELVVDDQGRCGVALRVTTVLSAADVTRIEQFSAQHECVFCVIEGGEKLSARILSPCTALSYAVNSGEVIEFLPTDFLQGNAVVNRVLVDTALDWLELDGSQAVLELYAGIGNFSSSLAARCKKLVMLEGVADMVNRAKNWIERRQITHVEAVVADLDADQLPRNVRKQAFDRVLLDPPRDGAKRIIADVARLKAAVIVYVSCNPATLARDAKVLGEQGYVLDRIALADMFPHTEHAECIARFVQKKLLKTREKSV